MRHIHLLAFISLLTANVAAQGLEPSLGRAAARMVERLSPVLLHRHPDLKGLAVVPDWGTQEEAGRIVVEALENVGYVIVQSEASSGDVLKLKVSTRAGEKHRRLIVETLEKDPWHFSCAYGDATWADEVRDDAVLVEGSLRPNREDAVLSARRAASLRLLRRAELDRHALGESEVLDRVSHRLFVGEEVRDDRTLYRAFFQADAGSDVLRRLQRAARREARRDALEPWMRLGAVGLLALVLGLGYLRADLSTKGYMTGRLRMLFGTLFALGAGVCWGVPL